ncbi:hypothetical protein FDECE_6205, partial [Fusarium decemcellulare]
MAAPQHHLVRPWANCREPVPPTSSRPPSRWDPNDALKASMKKLFETGSYSDLTVVCGADHYKVHKVIICPRSGFFAGACESIFQESQTGVINLPEDDPLAVKLMLHYLYHQDYSHEILAGTEASLLSMAPITPLDSSEDLSHREKRRRGSPTSLPLPPPVPTPTLSGLSLHAKVYALAEKYAIEDLKAVALDKFRTEAKQHWQSQDFVDVIQEVYISTVEHDRSLRDVLVDVICQHMELLDRPSFQDAVKDHR